MSRHQQKYPEEESLINLGQSGAMPGAIENLTTNSLVCRTHWYTSWQYITYISPNTQNLSDFNFDFVLTLSLNVLTVNSNSANGFLINGFLLVFNIQHHSAKLAGLYYKHKPFLAFYTLCMISVSSDYPHTDRSCVRWKYITKACRVRRFILFTQRYGIRILRL